MSLRPTLGLGTGREKAIAVCILPRTPAGNKMGQRGQRIFSTCCEMVLSKILRPTPRILSVAFSVAKPNVQRLERTTSCLHTGYIAAACVQGPVHASAPYLHAWPAP